MKKTYLITGALMAAVAFAGVAAEKENPNEKCYGVAKAGKNDCASEGNNSCAGTSTVDRDKKAWIYLPKGTCGKIAGGSLKPKG